MPRCRLSARPLVKNVARQLSTCSSFASDNTRGVLPEVMAALQQANVPRSCASYGADEYSAAAAAAVRDLFDAPDAYVLPTVSGIASDALAIASAAGPLDAVFCHRLSHIRLWQCGAVAFYSGGAPLQPLGGEDGKVCASELARALQSAAPLAAAPYAHRPSLLSLTQPTEAGTLYTGAELKALCALAHDHGLLVHMDGARLPNALVALGASASDLTWRAGVDMVSFGTTKGGTLAAEAVVVFKPAASLGGGGADAKQASELAMRRRRKRRKMSRQGLSGRRKMPWPGLSGLRPG